jgi:hypothetical protein
MVGGGVWVLAGKNVITGSMNAIMTFAREKFGI